MPDYKGQTNCRLCESHLIKRHVLSIHTIRHHNKLKNLDVGHMLDQCVYQMFNPTSNQILTKKSDCKAEKQKSRFVLKNQSNDLSAGTSEKQLIPEL